MGLVINFREYREAMLDLECIKRRVEKERLKGWKSFLEWKPAEVSAQKKLDQIKKAA
jgi:hypothetical protein